MTTEKLTCLLNEKQVANYLGVSVSAIRSYRSRKDGPAWVRVGRNIRYFLPDVIDYTKRKRVDPLGGVQ